MAVLGQIRKVLGQPVFIAMTGALLTIATINQAAGFVGIVIDNPGTYGTLGILLFFAYIVFLSALFGGKD